MMDKNFSEIKAQLISDGVRINGFGAWLYTREDAHRLGLDTMYTKRESLWFTAPHEKLWEATYQKLKNDNVNIENFAKWLISPLFDTKSEPYKDPFTLWGEAIMKFGQALLFWRH